MPRVIPGRLETTHGSRRAASKAVFILAALLPVGGHYAKHLVGPLKPFFMKDHSFGLSNTQFGALLFASDSALFFAPLLSGMVVDSIGAFLAATVFCFLSLFGHVFFCVGVVKHSLWNSIVGRGVYGIGESAVSIAQAGIICHTFSRADLTIALGIGESVRASVNWLGKVLPVTLADLTGNYKCALWFGVLLLLVSQIISLAIFIMATRPHESGAGTRDAGAASPRARRRVLRDFPLEFWVLTGIHALMNNVHNVFSGISTDYLSKRNSLSVETAALLSSLENVGPIFFCSWVSWHVSRYGGRLYWMLFACACSVWGFALLVLQPTVPVALCMVLLSFNTIILPTLLRSSVPLLLHPDMYGLGFGLYTGLTGLGGNVNILVGWLKDVSGSYEGGLYLLTGMSLLGVVLCGWVHYLDASRLGCLNLAEEQLRGHEEETARLIPGTEDQLVIDVPQSPTGRRSSCGAGDTESEVGRAGKC